MWGTSCAKALGQDRAWRDGGTARPTWLKQSVQGGEREEVRAGRGRGRQVRLGLVGPWEDFGF